MTYEYRCGCGHVFDVIKSYKHIDQEERCSLCNDVAVRAFVPSRLHFTGTKVEHAEYNPGLGCIVNNSQHRKELCKQRGLEEIGNEKPESLHKHFDKAREEKWEKSWNESDKGWVGNGDVGT